jgi:hypothetical protein
VYKSATKVKKYFVRGSVEKRHEKAWDRILIKERALRIWAGAEGKERKKIEHTKHRAQMHEIERQKRCSGQFHKFVSRCLHSDGEQQVDKVIPTSSQAVLAQIPTGWVSQNFKQHQHRGQQDYCDGKDFEKIN